MRPGPWPSVVVVSVSTRGLLARTGRSARPRGDCIAIILFEVARLLRNYPELNAPHVNGAASTDPEINIGFAIDAEEGPGLPVVRGADRKSLPEIIAEMSDCLAPLRQGSPSPETRSGGTFTISNLLDVSVAAYIPSPVLGQSAILGVCSESTDPDGSGERIHLALAFDPRVAGALRSARFLNDLKARLIAYDANLRSSNGACGCVREEARCAACLMPIRELRELGSSLIPRVERDGSESLVCSLCITGF